MSVLKNIPKVDKVLVWPGVQAILIAYPRPVVLKGVRTVLDSLRREAMEGTSFVLPPVETIASRIAAAVERDTSLSLKRVVNGTGVVIHTNLGRSPLPEKVREQLDRIAYGYSNLEFDLEAGERGSRYSHVEELLCELTGAEAALVVNNNAAAVMLALAAMAVGKEVVVSRGELVEIGGSFRIPDIMGQSGALLREVGTTNRTHPDDYRAAVTTETALFLKVHASNFATIGFTAEVTAPRLVELGRDYGLPVMADVGSGNLIDLARFGMGSEPTIQEFVRAGIDVVTFSGDKLLGGPQAGLIVGRKACLDPMKKHPLLRAFRIDKLTLAALEGTLALYRDERQALASIPTLRMLTVTSAELAGKGRRVIRLLRRNLPAAVEVTLVKGVSQVGGGALPGQELPTFLLAIRMAGLSPQELEARLRTGAVPVVGRIAKGEFLLDLRTILDADVPLLLAALKALV
ncbi:L-seryl-tRNA(Sec) selenium transferase [Geobacter sp. AOG1]|uniref:L-seryl-tRNA(Sec) selenium transferase n=1 Tax=Geobacter sp. AOG1 TaxID=1566346 RepID=UPI001CC4E594|nr:L-seryl-tRNA(Sec) selenium transferase [Geobacter sp. AOG1]GFE56590.1 L-seryl-tRNA(Sec) selenium transferase [Geobacter sp. AOG1]